MSSSEGPTGKGSKRARARRPAETQKSAHSRPRSGQSRAEVSGAGKAQDTSLEKTAQAKSSSARAEPAPAPAHTRAEPAPAHARVEPAPARVSEAASASDTAASTPSAHARRVRVSRQSAVPPAPSQPENARVRETTAAAAVEVVGARTEARPAPEQPVPEQLHLHTDATPAPALARMADADELADASAASVASTQASSVDSLSDDFGLDAVYEARLRPWFESLCQHYVKVEVHGAERIPADGRALLVANHTRAPLWDGIILRTALRLYHSTHRSPRWLVDDRQYHAPFLGTFVNRLGAVRACQENAERLLESDELVAVFPEGANGANRRYEDRHRLQRFGRGGFVKLALRTGTPVIPIAIVTCDHTLPAWHSRLNSASRALRAPFAALASGRSPLGLLSVPPITSPIRISVGEPVTEIARQDERATTDDALIHELNECVRGAVQELVNATLRS